MRRRLRRRGEDTGAAVTFPRGVGRSYRCGGSCGGSAMALAVSALRTLEAVYRSGAALAVGALPRVRLSHCRRTFRSASREAVAPRLRWQQ